jgi:hypothetical protein
MALPLLSPGATRPTRWSKRDPCSPPATPPRRATFSSCVQRPARRPPSSFSPCGSCPRRASRSLKSARTTSTPSACGVNVHAKVAFDGRDRKRLERLCRYLARPPLSQERLSLHPDGRVRLGFKAPWKDGTHAVLLDPRANPTSSASPGSRRSSLRLACTCSATTACSHPVPACAPRSCPAASQRARHHSCRSSSRARSPLSSRPLPRVTPGRGSSSACSTPRSRPAPSKVVAGGCGSSRSPPTPTTSPASSWVNRDAPGLRLRAALLHLASSHSRSAELDSDRADAPLRPRAVAAPLTAGCSMPDRAARGRSWEVHASSCCRRLTSGPRRTCISPIGMSLAPPCARPRCERDRGCR